MAEYIASRVKKARKKSLEEGQAKYRAYFVNTDIWADEKALVDAILIVDGLTDCIVLA